jgi:NAD(P)-dependent dehydrogenase (short-subunit alcohol dehydrogenase family)
MPSGDDMQQPRRVDPRSAYPRPPFPRPAPGKRDEVRALDPSPDHGERTYAGAGRLAGLSTVITGGDSGIGRAAAIAFAREGADVLIAYLEERADAEETIGLIEAEGRRGVAVEGDIADEAHCRDVIARAREAFGRIDVLVNNAAAQRARADITEIPTEEWEHLLRVNLTAPFVLCREAIPIMEPGASIINVASIQAAKPAPPLLAYATTKGGLVTFSKGLATMLAPRGIRVNVIAPGPVWTPLVASDTKPDDLVRFGADTPLGRPAQPVELAGAFVFLASPAASYITGAVLPVTGGEFFT